MTLATPFAKKTAPPTGRGLVTTRQHPKNTGGGSVVATLADWAPVGEAHLVFTLVYRDHKGVDRPLPWLTSRSCAHGSRLWRLLGALNQPVPRDEKAARDLDLSQLVSLECRIDIRPISGCVDGPQEMQIIAVRARHFRPVFPANTGHRDQEREALRLAYEAAELEKKLSPVEKMRAKVEELKQLVAARGNGAEQ